MSTEQKNTQHSFEEFKLYYESTEKVTDRRIETNRWNYSICIAILVAIATISNWSLLNFKLFWVGISADVLLCIMATLFCVLWIAQIRDFKFLNNAKFDVLNEMAPRIAFDSSNPGAVTSFCPFDKEWKRLSELNALHEMGKTNLIALKSSNIEYFIPKAFFVLFAAIFVCILVVAAQRWTTSPILKKVDPAAASAPASGPS